MQSTQPVDVPTPRTDDFSSAIRGLGVGYYDALAFARQLERELIAATAELERTREQLRVAREAMQAALNEQEDYGCTTMVRILEDGLNAFTQPQSGAVDPVKGEEGCS